MQNKITIADAPDCLNTNDKAMWVLGYQAALAARSTCLHQIQVPSATEQAAWQAGLDDGRAQAGFTVSNAETPQAAPAAVAVPDGWKLVPVKPTKEMLLAAGFSASAHGQSTTGLERWQAFLNNAPTPPSQARAALAATPAAEPDMVSVKKVDANNYCRILAALGVEEEGDPVAEVQNLLAAAAAPVVLPEPDGVANLTYFSYDSDSGVEFHDTEAEAIAWCEEALRYYREESVDGWSGEVESIRWGVVIGRSEQCDVKPVEDHPDFTETCDYQLKPYALLAGVSAPAAVAIQMPPVTPEQFSQDIAELTGEAQQFQQRVQPWMMACFGPEISADRIERNHRFLEESLELVQSLGCTASEAHQLVDYVFGRPVGDPMQEAGGVMVTLAALCLANDLDMHASAETELARIWTKVEAIRAKQAAKPKHSPLPMHVPQTLDDTALLNAMERQRIAVVPEYEGPWDAEVYNDDGEPIHAGSGTTPREAIRAAIAAAKWD